MMMTERNTNFLGQLVAAKFCFFFHFSSKSNTFFKTHTHEQTSKRESSIERFGIKIENINRHNLC
tara:strand:- start:491 stop:685 length:195 start_codon:yes stop_codon:yes gene_type:complete